MENSSASAGMQGGADAQMAARMQALLSDLHERVSGLEREIADLDLIEAERAHLTLAERLVAMRGKPLGVQLRGGGHYAGTLTDSAASWLLLDLHDRLALIALAATATLRGLGRAGAVESNVAHARTFASICRRIGAAGARVRISGPSIELAGVVTAVGHDYVEVQGPDRQQVNVTIRAISIVEAWGVSADAL